jgi:hypothetical protein
MTTINACNLPQLTANGQLHIGNGSAEPTAATLTAGAGIGITNGAGSITVANSLTINTQNANYNIVSGDAGKVVFSNLATVASIGYNYTLLAPGTAGSGWYCYFENQNLSSSATNFLIPASGSINGRSTFPLHSGNACMVYCDGSNYYVIAQSSATCPIMTDIYAALPGQLGVTQSTTLTQTQGVLLNSNVVTFPFFAPNNGQITDATISASVGLAASTVTVGVYNDNGYNSLPSGAAIRAVSISTATSGVKTGTFSTAIQLYANQYYWAAIQCSSAITLSLVNNIINTQLFPSGGGFSNLMTPGMNLQTLANTYSAGTLPTWSGAANSFQAYMPLIAFVVQ